MLFSLIALGMVGQSQAQTLLYQWNFDNATGTGAGLTIAPSYIDGSMTGGSFFQGNANNTITTPASSGRSGISGDLGVIQAANYNSVGSALIAGAGNLSGISGFTLGMWVNLAANYQAGGTVNARLFDINTTSAGDGNLLYFAINSWTNLQVGVNNPANTGAILNTDPLGDLATITSKWIFIGLSYNTAAGGTANLYVGGANTAASLAGTLTGVGNIAWGASTNFFMLANRNTASPNRGLPGTVDDVSLYSGSGDLAFIQSIQAVPEPSTMALAGLSLVGLVATMRFRRNA
jgi:hypothetical protein